MLFHAGLCALGSRIANLQGRVIRGMAIGRVTGGRDRVSVASTVVVLRALQEPRGQLLPHPAGGVRLESAQHRKRYQRVLP